MEAFMQEYEISAESDRYFSQLVDGVRQKQEEIDAAFADYLKGWTKDRLPRVDLTIIRLAVYEIMFTDEVPDSVAISEAVLLAKKFSTEESRAYINAVLGNVSRNPRAIREEIQEDKHNE
jgi:N utilization substance protein B